MQVASAAVEKTFPKDLRRSYKDSTFLKSYNIPASQPNEVQREMYKAQILQQLGVSMRPKDMQKAQTHGHAARNRIRTRAGMS